MTDSRIHELIEELMDSGRTPEQVCHAHPELLAEVQKRWRHIRLLVEEAEAVFPAERADRTNLDRPGPPHRWGGGPALPGYDIFEVLGQGGMGVVYRARHKRLDRVVAIKMLRCGEHAAPKELASLVREARSVAGMKHPNIVQVHDVGELDGLPYFTMEFVEGGSLAGVLAGAPQPAAKAAAWVSVLAHAVHAAHERGIVHRDLKPGNVLVTADGTLKVTDFGLARRFAGSGDTIPTLSARVGTPSYMPPEQALGTPAALMPAADVYSLGAILYEMLTGRPPFRGESPAETERQVLHDEPVPPCRLNPKTSRDLQTICLKCLQKAPERRYSSARALAEDLDRFRLGEPIRARPAGTAERTLKWVRRRPAQAGMLAAGLLVMVVAVGFGLWYQSIVSTRRVELAFRESEARQAVSNALDQATAAVGVEGWDEADLALATARSRRAEARSPQLSADIESLGRAVRLARALEETRLIRATPEVEPLDVPSVMDRYHASFGEAGLRVEGDVSACAAVIRASPVRHQLLVALDIWACLAYDVGLPDQGARLFSIAREADPGSPWRDRFRAPVIWGDRESLLQLAAGAVDGAGSPDGPSLHQIGLLGLRLGQVGADDVEAELLSNVLRKRPDDYWMNWELGRCYNGAGRFREAVAPLRAAVAARPRNPFACESLGASLIEAGDPEQGLAMFHRAADLIPTSTRVRYNLIRHLLNNGHRHEAETVYARWSSPDARSVRARKLFAGDLLQTRRWENALAVLREVWDREQDDPVVLANLGLCLYNLERFDEAEAAYREWLSLEPGAAEGRAHAWLSRTHFYSGRVDEAIAEGQAALASSLTATHFLPPVAEALLARGRPSDACAFSEQRTRASPSDTSGWIGLVKAQLGLRRFADAREGFARAASLPASVEEKQQLVRLAELHSRIAQLDARDPKLLTDPSPPLDAAALCDVAEWNYRCAARAPLAIRQFRAAFAADPEGSASGLPRARFHAACAALAAAAMPASGVDGFSAGDPASLRADALDWLSAERDALLARRTEGDGPARIAVSAEFRTWHNEPALVGVCGPLGEGRLPYEEYRRWHRLWSDIKSHAAADNPGELLVNARIAASLSDWARALDGYANLFEIEPDQDGEVRFEFAAVQVLGDDLEGYRQTCADMLDARAASSRIRDYHVARAFTLAPTADGDLSRAIEIGLREIGKSDAPWASTEVAALKYRAGQDTDVIALLKQSIDRDPRPSMAVLNWFWLALANDRAGNGGEARRWFGKAESWMQPFGNERPPSNGQSAIHLHNWLEAQVLRREAVATLASRVGAR